MKIVPKKSTENYHFISREKSLYIAWACFRNDQQLCRLLAFQTVQRKVLKFLIVCIVQKAKGIDYFLIYFSKTYILWVLLIAASMRRF